MVGIAAVIVRLMPSGLDTNLHAVKLEATKRLEKHKAQNITFTEDPIAFGLKALNIKFAWPEQQDTDVIEHELAEIPGISSAQIEDYRRAFG